VTRISPSDAAALVASRGAVVVDVREPHEVAVGHIPGALHVPLRTLAAAPRDHLPAGRPIVFVCAHGMRSVTACALAERAGVADVYSVDGGTSRWAAEGRPYEGTPAS
jgi:rhodanese-related sulfurtransferase